MDLEAFEMVPDPATGRRYRSVERVRLGDVGRDGGLRLDALVGYSQVLSNDDTKDAGLVDDLAWVARFTVVDVVEPAVLDEEMELVTFCGGLGRAWAERRISVRRASDASPRYELATMWVSIDPATIRPRRLTEQFRELYGEAAAGRTVSPRSPVTSPSPADLADADELEWGQRWGDFDTFEHMNNVVYWEAVQHALGRTAPGASRFVVDHGVGVVPDRAWQVLVRSQERLELWWVQAAAGSEQATDVVARAAASGL